MRRVNWIVWNDDGMWRMHAWRIHLFIVQSDVCQEIETRLIECSLFPLPSSIGPVQSVEDGGKCPEFDGRQHGRCTVRSAQCQSTGCTDLLLRSSSSGDRFQFDDGNRSLSNFTKWQFAYHRCTSIRCGHLSMCSKESSYWTISE